MARVRGPSSPYARLQPTHEKEDPPFSDCPHASLLTAGWPHSARVARHLLCRVRSTRGAGHDCLDVGRAPLPPTPAPARRWRGCAAAPRGTSRPSPASPSYDVPSSPRADCPAARRVSSAQNLFPHRRRWRRSRRKGRDQDVASRMTSIATTRFSTPHPLPPLRGSVPSPSGMFADLCSPLGGGPKCPRTLPLGRDAHVPSPWGRAEICERRDQISGRGYSRDKPLPEIFSPRASPRPAHTATARLENFDPPPRGG